MDLLGVFLTELAKDPDEVEKAKRTTKEKIADAGRKLVHKAHKAYVKSGGASTIVPVVASTVGKSMVAGTSGGAGLAAAVGIRKVSQHIFDAKLKAKRATKHREGIENKIKKIYKSGKGNPYKHHQNLHTAYSNEVKAYKQLRQHHNMRKVKKVETDKKLSDLDDKFKKAAKKRNEERIIKRGNT
jgi:hypothetical protein